MLKIIILWGFKVLIGIILPCITKLQGRTFEYDLILQGTKTLSLSASALHSFEYDLILQGTKTNYKALQQVQHFEYDLILQGTKTLYERIKE